ncbi:hypothetical protein ACFWA4_05850 [Streptomyces sp. NPDC060011]|uniref:hypothetical protein n=1 Tax=Streptomyces sp. NPDC060011 TaxID=3347037 RepID=UPI00367A22CC
MDLESETETATETQDIWLADLRRKAGMTPEQVAEQMSIPATATEVRGIETLYPNVMAGTLQVYLEAIGVTTTYALEGVGEWSAENVVPGPTPDNIFRMDRFAEEFAEVDEDNAAE